MRKVLVSNKGFAMTELLIASVAILGIFALLFANFLPLVAEYENREIYNNVTSKYAAFYLRKMYIAALEDPKSGVDRKAALNESIAKNDKNYFEVYNKKEDKLCPSLLIKDINACKNIINEYDIEEVLVTTYKVQDVKKTYPKNSTFSSYIANLPVYKNKDKNGKELYRLIIKTREYGYATTQILSDYKTNNKCLEGIIKDNGTLEITNYLFDEKDCSDKVILSNEQVTIKDKRGNDITGVITSIGENAFKDKNITSISYPTSVTDIKDGAFKNTKLKEFRFNTTLRSVGKEAFSNTNISEITIPSYVYLGDYAFKDNRNLKSITLEPGIKNIMTKNNTMAYGLFKNCGNGKEVILNLPTSMEYIGPEMFEATYVKNLDLGSTSLRGIEKNAFRSYSKKDTSNFSLPSSLESIGENAFAYNNINVLAIPNKVKEIGASAFSNSNIKNLAINSKEKLTIKNSAFLKNEIENLNLESVVYIGSYAFKDNSKLKKLNISSSLEKIGNGSFTGCPLLGKKEGEINVKKSGINWCKVLYDKDNCKTSSKDGLLKIEFDNNTKYVKAYEEGGMLD